MGAAAIVTGVFPEFQEFLDVEVPGFEIGAYGTFALAALIDGHGGVIHHLQKRHQTLRLAIGALDIGTERPDRRPVVAETTGPLGEQGVVSYRTVDAFKVVGYGGQEAGGKLRTQRAGIEQRRGRTHVVEAREQIVEFYGARHRTVLIVGQAHGDPHEEHLWQFEARLITVYEVAVVQRL